MSLDSFLNLTCTIARPTDGAADRYNQNTYADTVLASDVRCRLVERNVRLLDAKSSEYTWVKATVLLLPAGTDILPKDKVTIGSNVWLVKNPLMRQRGNTAHHVSVVVEALNG
jgi:hypothetical protein